MFGGRSSGGIVHCYSHFVRTDHVSFNYDHNELFGKQETVRISI